MSSDDKRGSTLPESDTDELRVFVASTLRAITEGLMDAMADTVAPSAHGSGTWTFGPPKEVAFDIAVTAKRTAGAKGGMKLEVFSVGVNAGTDGSRENSTISRISFSIPNNFKRLEK